MTAHDRHERGNTRRQSTGNRCDKQGAADTAPSTKRTTLYQWCFAHNRYEIQRGIYSNPRSFPMNRDATCRNRRGSSLFQQDVIRRRVAGVKPAIIIEPVNLPSSTGFFWPARTGRTSGSGRTRGTDRVFREDWPCRSCRCLPLSARLFRLRESGPWYSPSEDAK